MKVRMMDSSSGADDPLPRMPLRNPHLQRSIRHVRVDLRRRNAAVAEEALDVADVDAFLQEVGGDGVAEHVGGDAVADGGAFAMEVRRRIICG